MYVCHIFQSYILLIPNSREDFKNRGSNFIQKFLINNQTKAYPKFSFSMNALLVF